MLPNIVRLITDKLVHARYAVYSAFEVAGMPQRIEGAFVDPETNIVWKITLQRLN